mgnify:CR=1 FL=1
MSVQRYLATFHTHLSAMLSCQSLKAAGADARMSPVPRSLSSSCGTCVRYTASSDLREQMDPDLEALYQVTDASYLLILEQE